jgi:hypothetical protein
MSKKRRSEEEKRQLIDEFLTAELSFTNFARYKEICPKNLEKMFRLSYYKKEERDRIIKHYNGQKVFRKVNFTGIKETKEENYTRRMVDNIEVGKKIELGFMRNVKQVSKKNYRILYRKFCKNPKNELLATYIKTLNPDLQVKNKEILKLLKDYD